MRQTKDKLQKDLAMLQQKMTVLKDALELLTRQAEDREVLAERRGEALATWNPPKGHPRVAMTVTANARWALEGD